MNLTEQHLDKAVSRAVITADQRAALLALAAERPHDSRADEETFRFISGFNDIFLAIGVGLFIAAGFLTVALFDYGAAGLALAAAGLWLVSEILTARLRRAIPSMLAAAGFVVFATWASAVLTLDWLAPARTDTDGPWFYYAIGIAASLWSLVYFYRFRLPFATFLIGAALTLLGFLAVFNLIFSVATLEDALDYAVVPSLYALVSGLILFAIAIGFDRADPQRITRQADYGFWLHLLAAPLIVHAVMHMATGLSAGGVEVGTSATSALTVVGVFAVLAVVALVVNRRAILVAALTYLAGALWYLMSQSERTANNAELLSLLLISVLVIGLGVGWHTVRHVVLQVPPLGRMENALFSKKV